MSDERRYDDREVGLILRRVAELHEQEGRPVDARAMTRTELEQVVGELGISKALVARAVSELSMPQARNRPAWWAGGKTDLMLEQVVEGPIDDRTVTRMLEVLRRTLGDPGKLEHEGGARIWSPRESSRRVHLTLVEHDGRTTLRLEERMTAEVGATMVMGSIAGLMLGVLSVIPLKALLLKPVLLLVMVPMIMLGVVTGWLGVRAVWKRHSAAREQQLREAFGELLALAEAEPPALPEPTSTE